MSSDRPTSPFTSVLPAVLLGVLAILAGAIIAHGFSGPIEGYGDAGQWTFVGVYFANHITLFPLPHLDLVNDATFYPDGVNHVFTPWTFEANYFYALWYVLFGHGPWLQIYLCLSLAVQSVGMWALLRREFGSRRAQAAAVAATLGNAYLIFKFPGHFSFTAIHWTALGIVCDVLLFRRISERQPISARLLLLRAALAVLSLGQELAYTAAYGLVMLAVTGIWAVAVALRRGDLVHAQRWRGMADRWSREARHAPGLHGSLFLLLLAASFLYVPLTLEIVAAARSFDMTGLPSGISFSNPLRMLLPYLPWFHPGQVPNLFDRPEGLGAGSPGLSLTLLGLLGLWWLRRRLLRVAPLLTFAALLLLYVPDLVPTLSVFPWMTFTRVGSRATLVYPVLLVLLGLHIDWTAWGGRGRAALIALVALGLIEAGTVYALAWQRNDVQSDSGFRSYMRTVRATPGEAVLDWPFCAVGGNGIGQMELCPSFGRLNSAFTFRQHHGKKVLGQYLGRVHPSMLRPYLEDGLAHLVRPHVRDWSLERRQECFAGTEWEFFDAYFTWHDFAGINLYVDSLPVDCVDTFIQRFGRPAATARHFQAGRMAFIPKDAGRRDRTGVGARPRLVPPVTHSFDLVASRFPYGVIVEGLGEPIDLTGRGGLLPLQGAEARISFGLAAEGRVRLQYVLASPIAGQSLVLRFNGAVVASHAMSEQGATESGALALPGRAGANELRITPLVAPQAPATVALRFVLDTLATQGLAGLADMEALRRRYRFVKGQTLWFEQLELHPPPPR